MKTRSFPTTRMRRMRQAPWIRRLVAEKQLSIEDLIWPVFIMDGNERRETLTSMPGVERYTINQLILELASYVNAGLPAVALFPVLNDELKSPTGEQAWQVDNLMYRAISKLKQSYPDLGIIADVALDPYTDHGHDGILDADGCVDNDSTVSALVKQALCLAEAGCDVVAPSDMQDGRVGAIRMALEKQGFHKTIILSYASKYASCFYGPFRDAVGSGSQLGAKDKKTYQQDPANTNEALHEVELDIQEGADAVMIKPGGMYLDIVYRVKEAFKMPTFAYQVSGEYSMLIQYAQSTNLDPVDVFSEYLLAFKRAGCDGILTYAAPMMLSKLSNIRY